MKIMFWSKNHQKPLSESFFNSKKIVNWYTHTPQMPSLISSQLSFLHSFLRRIFSDFNDVKEFFHIMKHWKIFWSRKQVQLRIFIKFFIFFPFLQKPSSSLFDSLSDLSFLFFCLLDFQSVLWFPVFNDLSAQLMKLGTKSDYFSFCLISLLYLILDHLISLEFNSIP